MSISTITDDAEPSLPLGISQWSESQALQLIQDNLKTFMGKLGQAEQREYLRLSSELSAREINLSKALNNFHDDLSKQALETLETALKVKTGKAIDTRTTYLKTRIRQMPVPLDQLDDSDQNGIGTQTHTYKEDTQVIEYERSISLLDAAYRNFGFTAYFATEEQQASYISDDVMSVKDFVEVARDIDIGRLYKDFLARELKSRLSIPLFAQQSTKLMLALLDAYRTQESWGIDQQEYEYLKTKLGDNTFHWNLYQLDAGGDKVSMPFFTRRVDMPQGSRFYSYFPARPDGAFRNHASLEDARKYLEHQIRTEYGLKQFNWFANTLALSDQNTIQAFIKPQSVNKNKLSWFASLLYDLLASQTPNRNKLAVEQFDQSRQSLLRLLPVRRAHIIEEDLQNLARTNIQADDQAFIAVLKHVASETLSMLLLPLPGGVIGMNRIMLTATLGTLAYQSIEAVNAWRRGQQAEALQAIGDVADLLIGARLQSVGGKLSARRIRRLMNALGHPNYHRASADDRPDIWLSDTYTQQASDAIAGLAPDSQGLYEKNGQRYIELSVGGQRKVAKVTLDAGSGRYRLTNGVAKHQPYVIYSTRHKRWALDPIDTRALSEARLLQQILSPSELSLTPTTCQRALDVAGIDRQAMLDIWFEHQPTPPSLLQAIKDIDLSERLTRLQGALTRDDANLPDLADQVLPALLADLVRSSITLYDHDGTTVLSTHEPVSKRDTQPSTPIELIRESHGRYRTHATDSRSDSFVHHALREHERLYPDSTHADRQPDFEARVLALRQQLASHLETHQRAIFQALYSNRRREHLNPTSEAFRFAPSEKSGSSATDPLRRRFPALDPATATQLLVQHPSLKDMGLYASVDAPTHEAIRKGVERSTLTRALGSLADPSGRGLDENSQALFCNLITLLPNWPENLAVQVYQGTVDAAGHFIERGPLLDIYGSETADSAVMLAKVGNRYAAYDQDLAELVPSRANENSLVSALLHAMSAKQRETLELGLYHSEALAQDVLIQAHINNQYVADFLPPVRELPLASSRLTDFRAFDMSGPWHTLPDDDGLYTINQLKYIKIEDVAYRAMSDPDASTPERKVWRIVKQSDAVAKDEHNIYRASRAGNSLAVTRNAANLWVTAVVGPLGGMEREGRSWLSLRRASLLLNATANRFFRNPQDRARRLFPAMDQRHIDAFIQSLGDDAAAGLTQKENEYKALKETLKTWILDRSQGVSDAVHERATREKEMAYGLIKQCWRRQAFTLTLSHLNQPLPALTAGFSHVTEVYLHSIPWSAAADTFLANFLHIRTLSIISSELTTLPGALAQMQDLRTLNLKANRIRLDDSSVVQLEGLTQLQTLNLSGNPLEITPDFSGMSELRHLDLSSTAIAQWPAGLLNQARLRYVDLRHNRLEAVPEVNFHPPANQLDTIIPINSNTLLDDNPFPFGYWVRFERYWQRVRELRPALTRQELVRKDAFEGKALGYNNVRHMFPNKTTREINQFIQGLGADAPGILRRLLIQHAGLEYELNTWVISGAGSRHNYARAGREAAAAVGRNARLTARQRILECWRKEAPTVFAHDGTPIGQQLDLSNLALTTLPDLEGDFSHVASLKLNHCGLSVSPHEFLLSFSHIRWLDMSNNQLRELPQALGQMNQLTRLSLQSNQIWLAQDTARILSERTTLRGLRLQANPLGIAPDFSHITDLRSLDLSNTGLTTWPTGLWEQQSLDAIGLANNQITTIPDSVIAPPNELLPQSARVNNVTDITNNPLSAETLTRVRAYQQRLNDAQLHNPARPNRLVATALAFTQAPPRSRELEAFQRWTTSFTPAQITTRQRQWRELNDAPNSTAFFQLLANLDQEPTVAGREDLQRRVWAVLDAINEDTSLRSQLFAEAGEPMCCDRAAYSFSNLEVRVMVHKARASAGDQSAGPALWKLARGLFRLDELEKLISADIHNSETIAQDTRRPQEERQHHARRVAEEIEIRLAYRIGLRDRLQLPGQPSHGRFIQLGQVTQAMLDNAYTRITNLDNMSQERQALLGREFWNDYVANKYRSQFEAQRTPFQNELVQIDEQFSAGELTETERTSKSDDVYVQLQIAEAALISRLTRQEFALLARSDTPPAEELSASND